MGRNRLRIAIALGALVATLSSGHVLAATTFTDPVGDALFHAPAYADIVAGTVDEDAGVFEFTVLVADSIPETPSLVAPGVQALRWVASLDLDPAAFRSAGRSRRAPTAPTGGPLPKPSWPWHGMGAHSRPPCSTGDRC